MMGDLRKVWAGWGWMMGGLILDGGDESAGGVWGIRDIQIGDVPTLVLHGMARQDGSYMACLAGICILADSDVR